MGPRGILGTGFGVGPTDYPVPADVRAGTGYNFGALVGTLIVPIDPAAASGTTAAGHNDLIEEAVRAKIDAALPDDWNVYARRDMRMLPGDKYPLCYVVGLDTVDLEEQSDNEVLVGYPQAVLMAVKEATVNRTDPDLLGLRRVAQQAVYTASYPTLAAAGLSVEQVTLSEGLGTAPPDFGREEVTWAGFVVTVAVIESREVAQT